MPVFVVLFGAIGLALGSFGNVLIYRIYHNQTILGRSHCPACRRTLSWYELFPVLSFVILRGKCRTCRHHIPVRYPIVELGSMAVFLFALWLHPADPQPDTLLAFFTALVLYFLFLTCVFDATYQKVPDLFTLLIALSAFVIHLFMGDILSALLGALLMLVWFGGQWLVSRGRFVGTGDIFLATALGFWLGWPQALVLLVVSYMVGAVVVLVLLASRRLSSHQKRIAFVPFLGIATVLTLLGVGDVYWRMLG
jgi:leader peptidase (prepilin peptidase)/N-methyltransferase